MREGLKIEARGTAETDVSQVLLMLLLEDYTAGQIICLGTRRHRFENQ
jgi:hypothetical protein